jgi:hypothetical protein
MIPMIANISVFDQRPVESVGMVAPMDLIGNGEEYFTERGKGCDKVVQF